MKTRESGSFFQVLSTPRLCQWIPRPTRLFFTSPSNSKTQHLHSIFHSSIANCTASRVKVLDLASISANWCTELKFKVAQGQTLGTNVGHGVVSAAVGAELGSSLQYLMQSISFVQAGQPVGSLLCHFIRDSAFTASVLHQQANLSSTSTSACRVPVQLRLVSTSGDHPSQLSLTAACSGLHPVRFLMSPRMDMVQHLWAICVSVWPLSQQKHFFWYLK